MDADFVWNSTSYLVRELPTCPTCKTPLELTEGTISRLMVPAPFIQNKSRLYFELHESRILSCATCEHCEEVKS